VNRQRQNSSRQIGIFSKKTSSFARLKKIVHTLKISSYFVEFEDLALMDLEVITTLGIGGFGRVELVQVSDKII